MRAEEELVQNFDCLIAAQSYANCSEALHLYIRHEDCLKVIVLRGEIKQTRSPADTILSLKGVKHGEFSSLCRRGKPLNIRTTLNKSNRN